MISVWILYSVFSLFSPEANAQEHILEPSKNEKFVDREVMERGVLADAKAGSEPMPLEEPPKAELEKTPFKQKLIKFLINIRDVLSSILAYPSR